MNQARKLMYKSIYIYMYVCVCTWCTHNVYRYMYVYILSKESILPITQQKMKTKLIYKQKNNEIKKKIKKEKKSARDLAEKVPVIWLRKYP
jgi:hypothetical protein